MKKFITLLLCFVLVFTFAACGSSGNGSSGDNQSANNTAEDPANNQEGPETGDQPVVVTEPEIVWWHVKTETGIPTFVAEFKNNNSVPIDITFNVDYYKGSEHLYTRQELYANAIAPGESDMIWDTWDIPENADKIEVTYTYLEQSMYKPVSVKLVSEEPYDGGVNLSYTADEQFDEFTVEAAFFLKDHCTAIDTITFFPGEELDADLSSLGAFDRYVLYTNCYVYEH